MLFFSADSGVGKSTHTALWHKVYGDKVQIINDDKPIIRLENNELIVYGSPFAGGTMKFQNDSAVLGAIVFLEEAKIILLKNYPHKKQCDICLRNYEKNWQKQNERFFKYD